MGKILPAHHYNRVSAKREEYTGIFSAYLLLHVVDPILVAHHRGIAVELDLTEFAPVRPFARGRSFLATQGKLSRQSLGTKNW